MIIFGWISQLFGIDYYNMSNCFFSPPDLEKIMIATIQCFNFELQKGQIRVLYNNLNLPCLCQSRGKRGEGGGKETWVTGFEMDLSQTGAVTIQFL